MVLAKSVAEVPGGNTRAAAASLSKSSYNSQITCKKVLRNYVKLPASLTAMLNASGQLRYFERLDPGHFEVGKPGTATSYIEPQFSALRGIYY